MSDSANVAWEKFFDHRTKSLDARFPGHYRAVVVETNDPLNINRVRFKCPELHDYDVPDEQCPWAVPAPDLGGMRSGRFTTPVIGDHVWVTFEKCHPYGPVWTGFANPTRVKSYAYPQVFNISPVPVNEKGEPDVRPIDYDIDYLPKDGRPMAHGWVDRYGNIDIHSSVGYFPSEHADKPVPPDHDPISGSTFAQLNKSPEINNPDKKYMARVTKYGHIFLMGDQGYHWKKEENSELGEFYGDHEKDESFETKRWLFLQKLLNDNVPSASDKDGDQRKILMQSRYGTRLEIRDAGWAQKGPIESQSRPHEFGPRRILSNEQSSDYRWFKIRTKGGMLFQAYDKGFHPNDDKFIKRSLIQEAGSQSEREDKHWGGKKDSRWIRIYTRYGIKFVLDDRGSDNRYSDEMEYPRGNGVLIKGRRSPAAKDRVAHGNPRGFLFEFNESDKANHMTLASPLGQSLELNDRYQYTMIASAMGKGWVRKHRGLKENEFIRKPMMIRNPERTAHHLKLDHDNEYIRLKTRGNRGRAPESAANPSGVGSREAQQGFEARDGSKASGPWVELVDCQRRGLWFSKHEQLGIWRSKRGRQMYQWLDDRSRKIVIYNNEQAGTIEIYANQSVNVISNYDINLRADRDIRMRAGNSIKMQAGGVRCTMSDTHIRTNAIYEGQEVNAMICGVMPGDGGGCPRPGGLPVERLLRPAPPSTVEPKDRGATYNGPFEECPREEVEHEIRE